MEKGINDLSKGVLLLLMVDKCNAEAKLQNLGGGRPVISVRDTPTFNLVIRALKNKNESVPGDEFIETLSRLRLYGIFYNIQEAKEIINLFAALSIDIPDQIKACLHEVEGRYYYIDSLVNKKKYKWGQDELQDFSRSIDKSLKEYTFSKETAIKYLQDRIQATITEIQVFESKVKDDYGYFIEHLFNIDEFNITEYTLNDLLYTSQLKSKIILGDRPLRYTLKDYLDKKNAVKYLKERIQTLSQGYDSVTLETGGDGIDIKRPAVASYALMHVFWSKFDNAKAITKTNCRSFASEYEISHNTLLRFFNDQFEKDARAPEKRSIENKRYLKPYFRRFEVAVNMLESRSQQAFEYANKELERLKEMYSDYLK